MEKIHGGIKVFLTKAQTVKGRAGLRMQQRRGSAIETPPSATRPWRGISQTHLWFSLSDAHSLCLNLTVKSQSRPGQPWCHVQGSVDTKPFFQYDSDSNNIRPLGFLGKEVNDTKAWTELNQTVGEAGRELRMVLPVIKRDKNETRGNMGVGWGAGDSKRGVGTECMQGGPSCEKTEHDPALETRWT